MERPYAYVDAAADCEQSPSRSSPDLPRHIHSQLESDSPFCRPRIATIRPLEAGSQYDRISVPKADDTPVSLKTKMQMSWASFRVTVS